MGISKVIFHGETLVDLTGDTVRADKLLAGYTAHGADGDLITGTNTYDADTQDATAAAAEILSGKTAYNKGAKLTGTMPNNGAVAGSINTKAGQYTVPQGYHDGSGKVGIAPDEQAKIIPGNIRNGVAILGVEGQLDDIKADLMNERAIFDVLMDSSNECLLDSYGESLTGQVLFADAMDIIRLADYMDKLNRRANVMSGVCASALQMNGLNEQRIGAIETMLAQISEAIARLNASALLDSAY